MATANRLLFNFAAFFAGTLALGSCNPSNLPPTTDRADIASPSRVAQSTAPVTPLPTTIPTPTIMVKIYRADSQCAGFLPESVAVSKNRSMEAAIGKVIAAQRSADFDLAGYRISRTANVATVDLRVAPNSKRQIVSLSSCEQFALLGSIRETLIRNRQWRIKSVRFTDRGKDIVL